MPSLCLWAHRTGWKHYALNISGTFRDRKLKFYTHLEGSITLFRYENFFVWGVQGAQHPLVNIWDTVYISETIRARKSTILQALGYCQLLFSDVITFPLGACERRSTPNVNLGTHHISETIRAGKLKFYIQ